MSSAITDTLNAPTTDKSARQRRRAWIVAGVVGLLVVIGFALSQVGGPSAPVKSSSSTSASQDGAAVSAAAAEVAWNNQTAAEQKRVCTTYKVNSAIALRAIDNGIPGHDPALLAAFNHLLSKEC
jgi:4-amino-4-deoxy-L-arabinose transferase-like glycosyltransferase